MIPSGVSTQFLVGTIYFKMTMLTRRSRNYAVSRRGGALIRGLGGGAVGALYRGIKQFRGSRDNAGNKSLSTSAPLTTQYDSRRLYKYKRMPRRKRRAWVKFSRKVQAVTNALATHYLSYTSTSTQSPAAGTQAYGSALVYGVSGISQTHGNHDIREIVADLGFTSSKQFKLIFKSATLDAEWSTPTTNTCSVTLDMYEVIIRKDIPQATSNNIGDMFYEGINSLTKAPGSTNHLVAGAVGVTPFQSKLFCQNIKILSKTRVLMSPGQTCHKEVRDAKNRYLQYTDAYNHMMGKAGWTRGFFWVAEAVTDGVLFSPSFTINYADIRNYNVQYDSPDDPQGGRD